MKAPVVLFWGGPLDGKAYHPTGLTEEPYPLQLVVAKLSTGPAWFAYLDDRTADLAVHNGLYLLVRDSQREPWLYRWTEAIFGSRRRKS